MEKTNVGVNFANFNYSFILFQKQYRILCQDISRLKRDNFARIQNNGLKMANTFITEYMIYIKSSEVRVDFNNKIRTLDNDIFRDTEYKKLCNEQSLQKNKIIKLRISYYNYFIRLFEIIGILGDELSSTFMPNKSDRERFFKYTYNNSFFEEFTIYKESLSKHIANFDIKNFDETFSYLIGFYYAYYLFIDAKSRYNIEKVVQNILNIMLSEEVFNLINEDYKTLSEDKKQLLSKIDRMVHKATLKIFFRCNYSYSQYGITPKIEQQLNIDMTLI